MLSFMGYSTLVTGILIFMNYLINWVF